MNTKFKTIIWIVVFALFISVTVFAYNSLSKRFNPQTNLDNVTANNEGNESNPEKILAKDFTAYDADGNEVKLSDHLGKPIVLNFWASWCPPCKSEMPYFNEIYDDVKDEVVFLMVDMVDGFQETEATGKKYIEDNGFTFPVLYDTNQDAAYTYGISSLPSTIFIDKDGYLVGKVKGLIEEEILLKGIDLITNEDIQMKKAEYKKITAEEAKKMLDENEDAILLDVRTEEEFQEQRIDGAILIPDFEINTKAESELQDKDAPILIYCHSGIRSNNVANMLVSMGYTNVYDFGGIISYPYETVSDY